MRIDNPGPQAAMAVTVPLSVTNPLCAECEIAIPMTPSVVPKMMIRDATTFRRRPKASALHTTPAAVMRLCRLELATS